MRRLAAAVLVLSFVVAMVGCSLESRDDGPPDIGDVPAAVMSAVPRVTAVEDPSRWLNGFGHAIGLSLVTATPDPFTPEELDAVVKAIWTHLPSKPNTLQITAESQAGDVVDLFTAAQHLDELVVHQAGQAGVSIADMRWRYGQ